MSDTDDIFVDANDSDVNMPDPQKPYSLFDPYDVEKDVWSKYIKRLEFFLRRSKLKTLIVLMS